ncbi:Ebp2-domain-containing protein [Gyrodon lividus]|nr:Ebp2-domain-containing protein [Gyrodon lividus]
MGKNSKAKADTTSKEDNKKKSSTHKKSVEKLGKPEPPAPEAPEDATNGTDRAESTNGYASDTYTESEEDVDSAGMEKLFKLLGEDGLTEFDHEQLRSFGGDEENEDDPSYDEEEESGEEKESMSGDSGSESDDEEAGEEGEGEVKDEEIALDNIEEGILDEDAIPNRKVEIDNTDALRRIRETIQLDPSLPWPESLVVSFPETIGADVDDDLKRELAFYKQALYSADRARTLAESHSLPFTRPSDYFAEMVKSDAHMERIRSRLLDERAGIKKSEEKRKEREAKKFGKQVQLEKQRDREKGKKEAEERLKSLKRKRKGALDNAEADGEAFDIAVEDAVSDGPTAKRAKGRGGKNVSRSTRDAKFGFGGKGHRSKQNTKSSTDDFDSGPGRGGKAGRGHPGVRKRGGMAGSKRPGKSRRVASRSRQ